MEKELRQLQEQQEIERDYDVKRAVYYMIEVTVDAQKLNFKRDELPGLSRLVIMEGKKEKSNGYELDFQVAGRTCYERMGTHAILIRWRRMERDNQDVFITPSSSQTPAC